MRNVLGMGAVFAFVWLSGFGCRQPAPLHPPAHQFGGYHSAPPQQLQGVGVQQYPGAAEMPPAQGSSQQQFQPPAAQQAPTGQVEQVAPGSGPTQGR